MSSEQDSSLEQLSRRVGALLADRGWLLACAESCTGGWVAQVVTMTAGSSAWFDRGFVTYSNQAKQDMLGVRAPTLSTHGAVSEPVVAEMVSGCLARSAAEVALAISGIAGPGGGSVAKPVGTVCFAWARRGEACRTETRLFTGERGAVRYQSVLHALNQLLTLPA